MAGALSRACCVPTTHRLGNPGLTTVGPLTRPRRATTVCDLCGASKIYDAAGGAKGWEIRVLLPAEPAAGAVSSARSDRAHELWRAAAVQPRKLHPAHGHAARQLRAGVDCRNAAGNSRGPSRDRCRLERGILHVALGAERWVHGARARIRAHALGVRAISPQRVVELAAQRADHVEPRW